MRDRTGHQQRQRGKRKSARAGKDVTYECFNSKGLDDAGDKGPLACEGLPLSSSRCTAREKRRQKAGSRIPAMVVCVSYSVR
jgi:hypothetical protein